MTIYLVNLKNSPKLSSPNKILQSLDIPVLEIAKLICCQIVIFEKNGKYNSRQIFSFYSSRSCHVLAKMIQHEKELKKPYFGYSSYIITLWKLCYYQQTTEPREGIEGPAG